MHLPRPKLSPARSHAVALASGGILTLAFPEVDLAFLAWVAISPLLIATRGAGWRRGVSLGFVFGLGFFGTLLYWIALVGYLAWAVLVLVQAAFLGAFGALWGIASRRLGGIGGVPLAAALWTAIEFLRSIFPVGGFTWGQLAQSQHELDWMLRAASFGGAWAVAFVVVFANASVAHGWSRLRASAWGRGAASGVVAILALALPATFPALASEGPPVRVAIVQGNVPRSIPEGFERDLAIIGNHARLTASLDRDVDLVVWPESAVAIDPTRVDDVALTLGDAARAAGAPIVVGSNLDVDEDHYRVVALQVSADGEIVDRYQKTHLVPFGEYVPARALFGWLPILDQVPRDAIPGEGPGLFEVAGGRLATVLSFEGDFGSLVRDRIDAGGRLLAVATNTSTWGESWASAQHLAMSQVRAAENGVWVVHAAISGISAFVAPDGNVVDRAELWTTDTMIRDIAFADDVTFYARTGDWLAYASLLAAALGLAVVRRRRA
ncbi:MAG: apolipoprotein N-acyltransferase [Actinomycetota bacterium]